MKRWIRDNLGLVIPLGVAAIMGTAMVTSEMNCQGKEYLTGKVVDKVDNCKSILKYLDATDSYETECTSTISVTTNEGLYLIGTLGSLDERIDVGTNVKFLKKSTRYVTSFRKNKNGLLSSDKIESLEEIKNGKK